MQKIGIFLSRPIVIFSLVILGTAGMADALMQTQRARTADFCSSGPISSSTFVKTNHLLDLTDGFSVLPIKDGGYLLAGDTLPAAGMAAARPFIIKTDAKGSALWSRWFSSQSAALGSMSSRRVGRLMTETSDGNIVMANDMLDFIDTQYENVREEYGDILVTKLTPKGKQLWSVMIGDYGLDRPQKLWSLSDGGVMILGSLSKIGYGNNIADLDTVPRYSALIRMDKNGKVIFIKKMNWEAVDVQRLGDAGYIALAKIAVSSVPQPENILGPELTPHDLPTMIKLDSNLNVLWAKSLEMIPSEINAPTSYTSSSFVMGKTLTRMPGGDFRAIQPTPDGGFIAFGFGDLTLTHGLISGLKNSITSFTARPLVAVKVDVAGDYKWAKKLSTGSTSSMTSNDFQVTKTTENNFVIMQDVIHDSAAVQAKDFNLSQTEALASNIELIKIDADVNPVWTKHLAAERDLSGYGLTPTVDRGVIVSGSMLTTKQHMVIMGMEPYKEAALIKVDVNGAVSGCASVTDLPGTTVEDQSAYLVMQSMKVARAEDMKLNVNKKVNEKVPSIKNTVRDICQYKKNSVMPICSVVPSGKPVAPPVAKTWAAINYENTKEVAAEGEKNISIHEELLPILQRVYGGQVKLKDSTSGMWLTYVFSRPATRADVEEVQKKYAALGYKIDESEDGRLYVSRVGRTLHMTFSIQNSMVGKVEVLF